MNLPAQNVLFRVWSCAALAMAALVGHNAAAAPPSFTGQAIQGAIPDTQVPLVINLRQLGVVAGSAPLRVTVGAVFVNGQANSLLAPSVVATAPGAVCVVIDNVDFSPSPSDVYAMDVTVQNLGQQSVGPQRVSITNTPGPVVSPNDPACADPNTPPVANAGPDQTVADTNGQPGEAVALDASASTDADVGTVLSYVWTNAQGQQIATGPNPTGVSLPDGSNVITLTVTDDSFEPTTSTTTDTVTITIAAPVQNQAPTANAGADRSVVDSDGQPGETVTLDGSQSTDSDGTIASYQWFRQTGSSSEEALGTGVTLNASLPDGVNVIRLQVTDNAGLTASDTTQITVNAAPERTPLAELPNLTPNQQKMAVALDRICSELDGSDALTPDQQDLLQRCDGLYDGNTPEQQTAALDELNGEDFAAARMQTLLFANLQYVGVMDRLMALRGGAQGLSLAGLNIVVDGKAVSLASLQEMAEQLLGGGASSDADEPGGLLSDKWGLWARGNYSFGDKEASAASPSFDADQWAILGGLDYRLSDSAVIGGSLSYGNSSVDFNPSGEGSLDTESWAASLYGSIYAAKNFYFDGIVNVADSSYDATRNITYVDGTGLITADARGDTDGLTVSGGLSGGYDFLLGGLTVSPNLGVFYIDAQIDDFTERGAGGLNLIYDEQKFKSLTGNLGLRMTYAWKLSWGVLLPHVRADFVREFEDDVDVFGVRFAADPNANSTPPILVETDNPDTSYWRFAGGLSAQFKYGISGYIEYQRLESFQFISFQDVSLGLRMQRSF